MPPSKARNVSTHCAFRTLSCAPVYIALLLCSVAGCKSRSVPEPARSSVQPARPAPDLPASTPAPARPSGPVTFTDITTQAGIHFKHNSGAFGEKYLPETMGSGVCVIDYDNDGWQDILFVNSMNWPGHGAVKSYPALYHNNHDGTFTDVTHQAGLDIEMYGLGCTVGDYDNDGFDDIYITAIGGSHLFRNLGNGRFADVTTRAGLADSGFPASAVWFDYDRDGRLDLFVTHYVEWSLATDQACMLDGQHKSYCTPETYKGQSARLFHNLGNGHFEDVTKRAGLEDASGKSLGIALIDYDNDGWLDLFVTNDTQPNKLYRNLRNGRFQDEGLAAGVAFGEDGVARGAMGVDAADYDRSGRQHLVVGNFANQMLGLYHNEGNGLFVDEAPRSTVGRASLLSLTFGLFFFDYDLDGYPDILAANGHIEEQIGRVQPKIQYAELPLLLHNAGHGKFDQVNAFTRPLVARGAAYGDFDRDGDLDVLLATNNGPAVLYRNDGGNRNRWLQLKLVGSKSNRDGIGAAVRVTSAGGAQMQMVHSGSSYCSASDLALTFGLGKDTLATAIEIEWPSGTRQQLANVNSNQRLVVKEP